MSRQYIDAPDAKPLPYGLLSVADVTEGGTGHWQMGVEYEPIACAAAANVAAQACLPDGTTNPAAGSTKTVTDGGGTVEFDPITVYTLYGCRTVGEVQRAKQRAVDILTLGEGRALEQGFWETHLAGNASVVDLSSGAAVNADAAVAILEGFAADNYGGVPTLHLPRNIGSYAATKNATERRGNHFETQLGSLVANGAGYMVNTGPGGAAAAAGESWAYISGSVMVKRGTANVQGPYTTTINGDNELVALAERTFVATVDCFVAAIRVKNPV